MSNNETRLARNARQNGVVKCEPATAETVSDEEKSLVYAMSLIWFAMTNAETTFTSRKGKTYKRNLSKYKFDLSTLLTPKAAKSLASMGLIEYDKVYSKDKYDLSSQIKVSNPDLGEIERIIFLEKEYDSIRKSAGQHLHYEAYKMEQTNRTIADDWSDHEETLQKWGIKKQQAPDWAW